MERHYIESIRESKRDKTAARIADRAHAQHVAPTTVAFHFTPAGEMRALDFVLNVLNKRGGLTASEFREQINIWPEHLRGVFDEYTWNGAVRFWILLLWRALSSFSSF